MSVSVFDLVERLEGLWFAERCDWRVAINLLDVEVTLEWTQEYSNEHHADWVTYYWLFTASTVEGALAGAIEWCEGLLPFERCGACDGAGEYNRRLGEKVTCESCNGSGLERDVVSAT